MAMASGRKIPISTLSAARGTKSPFEVMESRKSGPPCPDPLESFTEMASTIGTAARTSSPIWLRRRPPISRISDRSSRVDTRRLWGRSPEASTAGSARSATDIEALPRQADERVLEAGRRHGDPATRPVRVPQRRHDPLGHPRPGLAAHLVALDLDAADAEPLQHGGRLRRS